MSSACYNGYCHLTPGRVRVRVGNLRNNHEAAKSLEVLMASQSGVKHVRANPITGNVLVRFDHKMLSHEDVFESLADLGHLPKLAAYGASSPADSQLSAIGMKIARVALKQALSGTPAAILLELF